VVLPAGWSLAGLDDSKRLTPSQREALFPDILSGADSWGACAIGAATIDRINILQATLLAMAGAVRKLSPPPELLLVDGRQLPAVDCPRIALTGGDHKSAAIAAASIIAKVLRDRVMRAWDRRHPGYGFASHKGYGSPAHREALQRLGPCALHRLSWRPVAQLDLAALWNESR
jgi:ribonuclease HII